MIGVFADWYLGFPTKVKHIIWWYPILGLLVVFPTLVICFARFLERGGFSWWNKVVFHNDGLKPLK